MRRGVEARGDGRLVDRLGIERSGLHLARDRAGRPGDLVAGAVVEGDNQAKMAVVGRQALGLLDQIDDVMRQPVRDRR